ncbi:MAG: rod shape-determining protein MreC [Thermodesulfobacteriota bacterium]
MNSFIKKNHLIIISGLLALFSLHLALTDTSVGERGYVVKRILSMTLTPVQDSILSLYRTGSGAVDNYVAVVGTKQENERYRKALVAMAGENQRLKEELKLSGRLKELLQYKDTSALKTTSAGIIAYNTAKWTSTAVINKGSADGLERNMAVISPRGIVGRIIEVTPSASTVLLNTDPRSNIESMVERTRVKAIAEGNGKGKLILKYVRELDDVRAGDHVITSGFSGLFPKGLIIGEVTMVRKGRDNFFNYIEVTPNVDLKSLEDVLVVLKARGKK